MANPDALDSSSQALADPRRPADRGLVGFGLVVQLWGTLATIITATALVIGLTTGMLLNGLLILQILGPLLVAVLCLVVGAELRDVGRRAQMLARVLIIAAAAIVGVRVVLFLWLRSAPFPFFLFAFDLLDTLAFPAFLVAALHTGDMREWLVALGEGEIDPTDRNRGLVSTGIAMTTLGGGIALAGMLALWNELGPGLDRIFYQSAHGYLFLATFLALMIRGTVFGVTGVRLMNGGDVAKFASMLRQCTVAHWLSLGVVLTALYAAIGGAVQSPRAGAFGAATPFGIAIFVAVIAASSAWPLILRAHAQRLLRHEDESTTQLPRPPFGPPVDGGLTSIGWILLAYAATALPRALAQAILDPRAGIATSTLIELPQATWFIDPSLHRWIGLLGVGVAAWAGWQAVGMRPLARPAVAAFSVVAFAAAALVASNGLGAGLGITVFGRASGAPHLSLVAALSSSVSVAFPLVAVYAAWRAPPPSRG